MTKSTMIAGWEEIDEQMHEYIAEIEKWRWLRRSLPFVDAIYVANSLTFNALHDDSDIDLVIITSPGRLRMARLWSAIFLFFLGLKRRRSRIRKKFCLSYFLFVSNWYIL